MIHIPRKIITLMLAFVLTVLVPQTEATYAASATHQAITHTESQALSNTTVVTRGGEMDSWYWNCETVNCMSRQESGVGRWMRYERGEAVVGVIIDRDHGSRMMFCHWRVADDSGWVLDGVKNYWPGEERYHPC